MNKKNVKHYYSIDCLKLILSICIVFHHFQQITGTRFAYFNFFNGVFPFENVVEFFFLISGYLTAKSFCNEIIIPFNTFIKKKIIRIYPMAMIATIATVFIEIVYKCHYKQWFFGIEVNLWGVVCSTLLIQGLDVNATAVIPPLWYISVLILMFVYFYIVMYLAKRTGIKQIYIFLFLTLLGSYIVSNNINFPFMNGRGLSGFFLGCFCYELMEDLNNKKIKRLLPYFEIIIVLIVLASYIFANEIIGYNQREVLLYLFFSSILGISISVERKIKKTKNLAFLGDISYNIYLWHFAGIIILYTLWQIGKVKSITNYKTMFLFIVSLIIFSSIICFIEKRVVIYLNNKRKIN